MSRLYFSLSIPRPNKRVTSYLVHERYLSLERNLSGIICVAGFHRKNEDCGNTFPHYSIIKV